LRGDLAISRSDPKRAMNENQPITLKEKVRALPDKPGVYLMKDRLGRIIYVGKARSLKKRVSSYFQRGRALTVEQPKIRALIDLIADVGNNRGEIRAGGAPARGQTDQAMAAALQHRLHRR
jgi:hypothetical protein